MKIYLVKMVISQNLKRSTNCTRSLQSKFNSAVKMGTQWLRWRSEWTTVKGNDTWQPPPINHNKFFFFFLKSYLKARRKAAVKPPLLPTTLQDFILVVGPTQILYISNLPRNRFWPPLRVSIISTFTAPPIIKLSSSFLF